MTTTQIRSSSQAGRSPAGVVSGTVLRLVRRQLGLSQNQAAEVLGVDPNTIRSWETGRRPLARVKVQTLRSIVRTLRRLGADPVLLDQFESAIDVDLVIGQVIDSGTSVEDLPPSWAPTYTDDTILAWALLGEQPAGLGGHIPQPRLSVPDRAVLLNWWRRQEAAA